jgi:hypothetical protein
VQKVPPTIRNGLRVIFVLLYELRQRERRKKIIKKFPAFGFFLFNFLVRGTVYTNDLKCCPVRKFIQLHHHHQQYWINSAHENSLISIAIVSMKSEKISNEKIILRM